MVEALNQVQAQMFADNIRLVHWVARRCRYGYGHGVLSYEDRIQAARIGLWKAILHHDPTKAKLSTFAVRVMINEILHTGEDERAIPQPPTAYVRYDNAPMLVEDILSVVADHHPNPEQELLAREESAILVEKATRVVRQRKRKGATWTASDVAAMISEGHRPAQVARILGVSRERIRQVVAAIRVAAEEEG